jgi:hypothetical protein
VTDPPTLAPPQSFRRTLAFVVAVFAVAGGVIHIQAAYDHRDLTVVATGFVVMAIAQVVAAVVVTIWPVPGAVVAAGALHAAILLIWILSRTVGLPLIPGAETVASFGVADVVANTFSIAVVAVAIVAVTSHRSAETVSVPPRTFVAIRAVTLAGAVLLTVVALSVPHEHGHDDAEGSASVANHADDHEHP